MLYGKNFAKVLNTTLNKPFESEKITKDCQFWNLKSN